MNHAHSILEAHLLLMDENRVLLLKRFNTGYEDGNYSLVAGHIEHDESATQAMIREAKEEADIILAPENLELFHVMHRNTGENRVSFFFASRKWGGVVRNMEPHKCDDLSWFPADELPVNTVEYIRVALDLGWKNIKYSNLGWDEHA